MSRSRLLALLLVLITLAAYLPVTRFQFLTYDDDEYVTQNPFVQAGLTPASMVWAFTTGRASNWHPVTWLSHMLDCELFGLNAGAQHFVNVIFHAANAALFFGLLLRLTKRIWPSAFVAALFAWHPLHVESVAWIAERKDVLSTFFALLALWHYASYVQRKSRCGYWLALFFFAIGLMAKPMLVTLPCVLLLLDFWPLQRFSLKSFRFSLLSEKLPFFLLAAASCVITFLVQQHGHAVDTLAGMPLGFRFENAVVAVMRYLEKIFWPAPLAVIYPLAPIPAAKVALAVVVLLLISIFVWRMRDRQPCWLVGWLWFLGMLVPVIGLVQVGSAALADRYTYLSATGIFMAGTFGLTDLAGKHVWLRKVLPVGAVLALTGSLILMERQLHYWRDSETLFRHAIAVTQNNYIAHLNLAITLDQQDRCQEALAEYREALRLSPDRQIIHFNIGCLLDRLNRPAEALAEYQAAIRFDPKVARWHSSAGSDLATLGHPDEALQEFAEAERLKPDYAQPHIETAKLCFQQSRDAEAVAELHAAVRAEPDNFHTLATVARYLAANADADARDGRAALQFARKANGLSGRMQPFVFDVLGMAYAENGDFSNAVAAAQNALQLAEAAQLNNLSAISNRLILYQNRQPWRESFRATNAPVEP